MSASDDRPSLLYPSQRLREVVEPIEGQYAAIMQREYQNLKPACFTVSTWERFFDPQQGGDPYRLTLILPRPARFLDVDRAIEGEQYWSKYDEKALLGHDSLADTVRGLQDDLERWDGPYPHLAKLELIQGTHQMAVLQEYRLELLRDETPSFAAGSLQQELLWREIRHQKNKPLRVSAVWLAAGKVPVPDFVDQQARFYLEYMSKLRAQTTTQPPSENQRESDDQAHQANLDRQRRRLKRQLDLEIERVRTISSYLEETVSTLPIDEDEKARLIRELRLKFSEEGEQDNDDVEILG